MPVSEERLQVLLPRRLKTLLQRAARERGLTVAEYVRRLISADLGDGEGGDGGTDFPFGENPIHTGRTSGSTDHDRL
jgi:hypothetical protein